MQPQKHLLCGILRIGHIPEHPVGQAKHVPLVLPEDLLKGNQVAGFRPAKEIDIVSTGSIQRIASRIQCGLASIHVTNIYEMAGRNVETGSDRLS
jgi:hypothetical protein